MTKSEAEHRRELVAELERLTNELKNVRVQKSIQRQRIEELQVAQNQLKNQLEDSSNANDKELRSGLAQQLNQLSQAVDQRKIEHSQVTKEWKQSQEEYQQLQRTVGLLQGKPMMEFIDDQCASKDDDSLQDDLNNIPPAASTQSKDFLQSMWGSMKGNQDRASFRTSFAEGLADEATASQSIFFNTNFDCTDFETMPEAGTVFHEDEEAEAEAALDDIDGTDDGGTVITEHTKDSLQVYRKSKNESRPRRKEGAGGGGLGNFFEKEKKKGGTYTTSIKGGTTENRGAIE